jgi:hypothetical protein
MGEVSAMYLGTMASYEVVTRLEDDKGPKGIEELRVHAFHRSKKGPLFNAVQASSPNLAFSSRYLRTVNLSPTSRDGKRT